MTRQESEQIAELRETVARLETHVLHILERVDELARCQQRLRDAQSDTAAKVAAVSATVAVLVTIVARLLGA